MLDSDGISEKTLRTPDSGQFDNRGVENGQTLEGAANRRISSACAGFFKLHAPCNVSFSESVRCACLFSFTSSRPPERVGLVLFRGLMLGEHNKTRTVGWSLIP